MADGTPPSAHRSLPEPGRIVPAADHARITATSNRLRQAQSSSLVNLEALHEAAWEHGHRSGMRQAMRQLAAFHRGVEEYRKDPASPVRQLVIAAVRKILGDSDPNAIVGEIVEKAIVESCKQLESVVIYVHPAVAESVAKRASTLNVQGLRLDVRPTEDIPITGCELHTAFGTIDASLETQLDALERSVCRGEPEQTDA